HELESLQNLCIGKSSNRKVIGVMTSLKQDAQHIVAYGGGLNLVDEMTVSAQLVWTLIGQPFVKPIEELAKRIPGVRTPFDPLQDVGGVPSDRVAEYIMRSDCLLSRLGIFGLRGFLFAVLTAPDMVTPTEWTDALLEGDNAAFESQDEAMEVLGLIHEEYNRINEAILDGVGVRPEDCPLRDDAPANFDPTAPVQKWSAGFIVGFHWLSESWEATLGEETLSGVHTVVGQLVFFASRKAITDDLKRQGFPQTNFREIAEEARDQFYESARMVATIGRLAAGYPPGSPPESPPEFPSGMVAGTRSAGGFSAPTHSGVDPITPSISVTGDGESVMEDRASGGWGKVGRNEPCPCGSGKKYKYCHGR
ncbi:MAG: UPF0149 family protein, partial [Rhodothermia bacterium]